MADLGDVVAEVRGIRRDLADVSQSLMGIVDDLADILKELKRSNALRLEDAGVPVICPNCGEASELEDTSTFNAEAGAPVPRMTCLKCGRSFDPAEGVLNG